VFLKESTNSIHFVITKGKRPIANCIDETIIKNDKGWPYSEGASTYFKLYILQGGDL